MLVQKLLDQDGMTHWLFLRREGEPLVILSQHEAIGFAEAVFSEQEAIEGGSEAEDD